MPFQSGPHAPGMRPPRGTGGQKLVRPAGRSARPSVSRPCRTSLATFWPGKRSLTAHMPGGVAPGPRRAARIAAAAAGTATASARPSPRPRTASPPSPPPGPPPRYKSRRSLASPPGAHIPRRRTGPGLSRPKAPPAGSGCPSANPASRSATVFSTAACSDPVIQHGRTVRHGLVQVRPGRMPPSRTLCSAYPPLVTQEPSGGPLSRLSQPRLNRRDSERGRLAAVGGLRQVARIRDMAVPV